MKGVILAGGTGSRLYPLTKVTNKHLLPVGRYPMIFHALYRLKEASVYDILIVTGKEHMGDVVNLLGSGKDFGVRLTYRVQDEAGGIAQALGLAETFVGKDKMVCVLGDNLFSDSIAPYVHQFAQTECGAKILLCEVTDPTRFGVPKVEENQIVAIEEKPQKPSSNYAVTGIYMYDHHVFDVIRSLQPSARGEYEITDVNNDYIARSQLTYDVLQGWWSDAGTHESLAVANERAKHIVYPEWDELE